MRQDLIFRGKDGDFHYIDWGGDGPLLHIAHATGFCAGVYGPLAERLTDSFHVVAMDDRGHGLTTAPADPRRLRDWDVFARDLERFFESLGGPVTAMGHSRGGVASLMTAVRRPDLVRALVLVDPTILPYSWMWWWYLAKKTGLAKYVPIANRAGKRKARWPDRATMLSAYRGRGAFRTWGDDYLESYVQCGTVDTAEGGVKLCCDPAWESRCFAVCPHDVWRYVPKVKQPTLLLYGRDSDTFLPAAAERFRRVSPKARVKGYEGASHFVPMERQEATAAELEAFAGELGLLQS